MATGGTIAGKGAGAASSGVYQAGEVGIAALVEAVPDLLNISNIYGYQIVNVDSGRIVRLSEHGRIDPQGHLD
jgi:L-asparaginase